MYLSVLNDCLFPALTGGVVVVWSNGKQLLYLNLSFQPAVLEPACQPRHLLTLKFCVAW